MTNALVGFPDWTSTVTWSTGSWEAGFPVSNVGDENFAKIARTTDLLTASCEATGTLATAADVRLFGIVFCNPTTALTYRVRTFNGVGTQLYDSGSLSLFPASTYETGRPEFLSGQRWTAVYDTGASAETKSFEVTFSDSSNPDGHVDVAYIGVADAWELEYNIEYGASFGFRNRTRGIETYGGAMVLNRRRAPRFFEGGVTFASRSEVFGNAWEHQRLMGADKPFLWWPQPSLSDATLHQAYFARNYDLPAMTFENYSIFGIPFALEEVL